jgi:hypothetical protein
VGCDIFVGIRANLTPEFNRNVESWVSNRVG